MSAVLKECYRAERNAIIVLRKANLDMGPYKLARLIRDGWRQLNPDFMVAGRRPGSYSILSGHSTLRQCGKGGKQERYWHEAVQRLRTG